MTTVDAAYAEVERVTRARARNFAYGIMLLPKPKRRAIAAIYAFAREVDDIADDPGLEDGAKRQRLEQLRAGLEDGADDECDVRRARRRAPPVSDPGRCAPRPRRRRHPGHGAGAVRDVRRSSRLLPARRRRRRRRVRRGLRRDERQRAETLGVALQLINIIRDVAEDWTLGRVYLPQDELAAFGVSEADIAAARCSAAWRALMAHQAKRARAHLAEGRTLLPRLDRRSSRVRRGVRRISTRRRSSGSRSAASTCSTAPPQLSPLTKLRIVGAGVLRP